ncbi:MAG: dipeptide epimerase [Acidobacteriota bacterium]|nr:dipeptide epimerase [Acidobacteriota bacterium]
MKCSIFDHRIDLKHTFTIANRSSDWRPNLSVRLEYEGIRGYGLAAPNPRYGETPESCRAALEAMCGQLEGDPRAYEPMIRKMLASHPGEYAAKAALDMAIMDLAGKLLGAPLYRMWGLDPAAMPPTSFTIGIDTPEKVAQRAAEARGFRVLKIKLGSGDDQAIIRAIRTVTDVPVRVDANEGWTDRETALREIEQLAKQGIELVEQPMPAAQVEDMIWLKARSPLPLIADEAFTAVGDLITIGEAYHGVNLKLMKCGGTLIARDAIAMARSLGLKIMLGCMVESALGIAAAAHLGPLADFPDLDGNLLISNDPYSAHPVSDGRIRLLDAPGLGVAPLN